MTRRPPADPRSSCPELCLADLSAGKLDLGQTEVSRVVDHLETCSACREDLLWISRVDNLLGPGPDGHPPSAQIVGHAAGELEADQRRRVADHLRGCAPCQQLERAARAGLDEAEQVEAGLRLLEEQTERPRAALQQPLHQVVAVAPAPPPRALAASDGPLAPFPEDRRVLAEEEGRLRLTYFRVGGRGQLGIFSERLNEVEVQDCTLDHHPLVADSTAVGGIVFDLGAVGELPGRTLRLGLKQGDHQQAFSWTLILEEYQGRR